jgi:hypothetical protein
MPIKTQSAKAKARLLQKSVCKYILDRFPDLEPDDCKSTAMGSSGEDVQLSPAARKQIPISVECKARKGIAIYDWYEQAGTNCKDGLEPVLVVKADRKKPLVCVDADYFFDLMRGRYEQRK